MNTENVKIVELNTENWYDCCELEVSEEQTQYMEPNAVSIAQSKFETSLKPYAIYTGDKAVGFLMYNSVPEELDGYWVYRIMVDKAFQGQGIGKAATKLMITEMAKSLNATKIVVGYHPDNLNAHNLYASLGFENHGDRFGKEMAVVKQLID
ncbi:spermine/spermidine acetyltransferase, putative [Planococcus halocryophilus Or1]|uniref:N-acetyltransferase n=1 Tax=Planococcus halocryophilus TaxID=1215089 RepID=A0A1C7DPL6_9BACL|nr:GNAT family N-acetyltransferase [Planococcus halocryophilus]ANU13342.1 N-acetyltransferase [Planococcus halocryophilus]EMF46153.1 spermine/spermidine acetyltransferase, putative [Planococcus halocryophilus Or1]